MPKSLFLAHFQNNVAYYLEELLVKRWELDNLDVYTEDSYITGSFDGIIDLTIYNEALPNYIIGLEIEHLSSHRQAIKNIEKLKKWAHNSPLRRAGLLHILNERCYIGFNKLNELLSFAKEFEKRNMGFYYDYVFYNVKDERETRKTAENLVNSLDFQARLMMLLKNVGLVE
ncbi:MAG: hypothetical protein GX081_09795 [Firmicutes bacterium]|nr:hypothetical protein [Bacillota bacterium]